MTRSNAAIAGVALFTLLLSSIAAARQPAQLRGKAKRLTKYFKKAHAAVVNGGVAPYAKVTHVGVQARLLGGLQAGVSTAKMVDRGMQRHVRSVYGGGSFGIQLGLGPEVSRMSYFGQRGMNAAELMPGKERSAHAAYMVLGWKTANTKADTRGFGRDVGLYTGFGRGGVARRVVGKGQVKKTPMLQQLEEGLKLSGEVNSALRAGQVQGVSAKLRRLDLLHKQIASQKKELNHERRQVIFEASGF